MRHLVGYGKRLFLLECSTVLMYVHNLSFFELTVKIIVMNLTPDRELFSAKKYWYFSYFCTKTYVVGTH